MRMPLYTQAFTSLCYCVPKQIQPSSVYETIDIFSKENEKQEKRKRKQSYRTGCRQAKRNRNKSRRVACEVGADHYAEVFLPDRHSPSYLRFLFFIPNT